MKIVCSYCKKDLGVKEPLSDTHTSHGICTECYERVMEHIAKMKITKGRQQNDHTSN